MTAVGGPHSLAWNALGTDVRAFSGMPRGKCKAAGPYARYIAVVGARAADVAPPDGGPTSASAGTWQRIGQQLRWYCDDSYAAAYDLGKRIVAGADVEIELARFSEQVAAYPTTTWVHVAEGYRGRPEWVTPARAAKLAASAEERRAGQEEREAADRTRAKEMLARVLAARVAELKAGSEDTTWARKHLDEERGRDELLDLWREVGVVLFDHDPRGFITAINLARAEAGAAYVLDREQAEREALRREAGVIELFPGRGAWRGPRSVS